MQDSFNLKWYGLPQQTISFQISKRLSSWIFASNETRNYKINKTNIWCLHWLQVTRKDSRDSFHIDSWFHKFDLQSKQITSFYMKCKTGLKLVSTTYFESSWMSTFWFASLCWNLSISFCAWDWLFSLQSSLWYEAIWSFNFLFSSHNFMNFSCSFSKFNNFGNSIVINKLKKIVD